MNGGMVYYCYTNIILIRTRAFLSQIFGKDLREASRGTLGTKTAANSSRVPSIGPGAGGPVEDGHRSHGYPKGLHMIHHRPRQIGGGSL